MIKIENLIKSYNGKIVLKVPELSIGISKLVAIIGPNGSGKTTLLSSIACAERPTIGNINIDGADIDLYSKLAFAKKVSFMKQSTDIDLSISIEDLVSFGRYPYTEGNLTSEDRDIIKESLKATGIYRLKDKYINQVSGGEKQRALLSLVLAQKTKYILLDEPLNNLDMKSAYELIILLRSIVDRTNSTVVIIVHDINFAMNYADTILLMDQGEIVYNGSPKNLDNLTLTKFYNIPIDIIEYKNKNICVYF